LSPIAFLAYWLGSAVLVASIPAEGRSSDPVRVQELRVCADPNNLPFSNRAEQGFENALADLVARDLGKRVRYTWWPQRRGFVRNTLAAGTCDVIIGVPAKFELAKTTKPYYRSTYVFVTRARDALDLHTLDDPRLRRLRIGLHAIGDDGSNVPPAHALAAKGIVQNVRGYSIYGDYSQEAPPSDLLEALVADEIDVAIAWGPLGGYFAQRAAIELTAAPIEPLSDSPFPMQFDVSMAVRHEDRALHAQLEEVLSRRRADIHAVLERYGVPLLPFRSR
jgi:mxaJ protein